MALSKHGYSGGPSVLYVPPPKESDGDQDWSWSCGKRKEEKDMSESIEEREITQQRANEGAIQVITFLILSSKCSFPLFVHKAMPLTLLNDFLAVTIVLPFRDFLAIIVGLPTSWCLGYGSQPLIK